MILSHVEQSLQIPVLRRINLFYTGFFQRRKDPETGNYKNGADLKNHMSKKI
jgi:hypothetical protein